ncbi:MAG: tryptophan--tRNA ligase, partial [Lacisediminimonas sp.]|nr:tryptophan--tRNA ligase [Lacisediminimonas sp.]
RHAVGLRPLGALPAAAAKSKAAKAAAPAFKQYREKDGRFYFKLLDADARLLLQSQGFESPRDVATTISNLQKEGSAALAGLQGQVEVAQGIADIELETALRFFAATHA